ncbi:hypothetical protein NL676_012229 [Syzygium grande]|nr:hypothetical protein NL676_012229 [Syzygium grande]
MPASPSTTKPPKATPDTPRPFVDQPYPLNHHLQSLFSRGDKEGQPMPSLVGTIPLGPRAPPLPATTYAPDRHLQLPSRYHVDMEGNLDSEVEYEIVEDEEQHEELGGLAFEPEVVDPVPE